MRQKSISLLLTIECSANFHWLNGQNQGDSGIFFVPRVFASIGKKNISF